MTSVKKSADNDNGVAIVCAVCGKTAEEAYKPFCSKRCADVDLHRWLSGGYAIPSEEPALPDEFADE